MVTIPEITTDELAGIRIYQGKVTIPVIRITRPLANIILAKSGSSLEMFEEILARDIKNLLPRHAAQDYQNRL